MQSTSTAYQDAIAQAAQTPIYRVVVDSFGDISQYVESVSIEDALTTDLPEETTQVAGYVASKVTVDLLGDPLDNSLDAAWLWSPYNSASPFYSVQRIGATITVELGYETGSGPEFLTVFTGQITRLIVDSVERTATLEALDGAERLRHRLDLPMVVAYDNDSNQQGGLNSQWVIDAILRSGGFCASPPQRPTTIFSATLHGSFAPESGSLDSVFNEVDDGLGGLLDDPGTVLYAQGKWGLAPTPPTSPQALYIANYTMSPTTAAQIVGTSVVMQGWVNVPSRKLSVGGFESDSEIGWNVSGPGVEVVSANVNLNELGQATVDVGINRATGDAHLTPVPITSGWHYLAVQVIQIDATHFSARVRIDGVTTTIASTAIAAYVGAPPVWTGAQITGLAPCEAVQFFTWDTTEPTWDDAFVPTATLEPGLSNLTAIPATSAADAFELLKEITAAEAGTFTFTGDGRARFWNRQHWLNSNTTARTLTTTESVLDLTTVEASARTRNRIRVSTQPLSITPEGIIWQDSGSSKRVPPRGTLEMWADLGSDMAYQVDTSGTVIPSGGPTVNGQSGYRAARKADGTGGQVANLTMKIEPFVNTVKITATNPNSFEAWLVSPTGSGFPSTSDGQPSIALIGRRITRTPAQLDTGTIDPQTVADSVVEAVLSGLNPQDERVYEAPSTPWRQSADDAQSLADDLLRALHRPMPQVQDVSIVADPSLELGDRVRLQDPSGLQLDEDFWIVGITTRFDASGMAQSLTLRPLCAPGQWIWGRTGRNIFGVTPW